MAKAWAKAFYNSAVWQRVREAALIRDGYLCTCCGELAEEVHHIIPLTAQNVNDPKISLNLDNLSSLCEACHKARHSIDRATARMKDKDLAELSAERMSKYEFDANGFLVPISPP